MTQKEKRLSPQKYLEHLKNVDLISIFFKKYNVKSDKSKMAEGMEISLKDTKSYDIKPDNDKQAITKVNYFLKAYKQRKSDFAIQINCDIEILLESTSPFNEDFLDIYIETNLNLNAWPYFREFVQDATQRVGLPPLTLPFYRSDN